MPKSFSVTIENLPELRKALSDYPKIAEPIYQKAIVGAQFMLQKHTLKDDPVPWRTGGLLQSFRFRSSRLKGEWYPTASYAAFVEFGTRPHEIRPKNGRLLAWQSGGAGGSYATAASGRQYYKPGAAGNTVFAGKVNHPGTKAKPYMGRIVHNAEEDITGLFSQASDMVLKQIAEQSS